MKTYKIAVVPGDGIGKIIALGVLSRAQDTFPFELRITTFPWGAGYHRQHHQFMPDDSL